MRPALDTSARPVPSLPISAAIVSAARVLLSDLNAGRAITVHRLADVMTASSGRTDADGGWLWKDAYDATETAYVLFLRRHLPALRKTYPDVSDLFSTLSRLADLSPTHTRRSEESQHLQQFSTPLPLAAIIAHAAAIGAADVVLEPSAGTGLLAAFAKGCRHLHLNEIAPTRSALLASSFPEATISTYNAEAIDDLLDVRIVPSVIIMNPPFSASPYVKGGLPGADSIHLASALRRLAPGGRLVAITSNALSPADRDVKPLFDKLSAHGTLRLSRPIWQQAFGRHGTGVTTRLTIYDKVPDDGWKPDIDVAEAMNVAAILGPLTRLPPRAAVHQSLVPPVVLRPQLKPATRVVPVSRPNVPVTCAPIDYAPREASSTTRCAVGLYEPYEPERIHIPGAKPHPTPLVQSAAMASVRPPLPNYRPHLPSNVITDGLLSEPQLESIIYAGNAHAQMLHGHWLISRDSTDVEACSDDHPDGRRFRRGWFLGDGTGAGKGRQVAGIVLDSWLKGRRKALWISKSDKLLEDAKRDWAALGQEPLLVVPQSRYGLGKSITLPEGILFTTYATLRGEERSGKASRLSQITQWLGDKFDGVIIFDEAHAMANAAPSAGSRGVRGPSQQGLAGLRLQQQLPDARVVYVSATGATAVENLAYAQRLGLWGGAAFPFPTRGDFVQAMHDGGIAAMEVLARDLKSLGLYMARALSYHGVEVDILEHTLTPAQIAIYDRYAYAYQIIHQNLVAALEATRITSQKQGTLNRNALNAARSAFESNKQRFFNHLITAMKVPTLLSAIAGDVERGDAVIVQITSTSEALLDRRLADIPVEEWDDLNVDVTPREYVFDYLKHSFPVALYQPHEDAEGNIVSAPMYQDGAPVICREAMARRDALLEELASLPPIQAALDQIIHHFGDDKVAEITGRSRRIVRTERHGQPVLKVVTRSATAGLSEAQSFMNDEKPILVFSEAGGTGRSYHADLASKNQRRRVHYLLEAGWKADTAIQGLGRSNRTNQKVPPVFRPVASDVRGEKRFLSTIARRLDTLGAITRGQRQTGGQGLFRPEDNLESPYAWTALRQFYSQLYAAQVPCCSLREFIELTGLNLLDGDETLREDLPPMSTFLNRILALPIALQNALFTHFDGLIAANVERARIAGKLDVGLETITATSLAVTQRTVLGVHEHTGAETTLLSVTRTDDIKPRLLEAAFKAASDLGGTLLRNGRSGRVAVSVPTATWTLDDGTIQARVRLLRPFETEALPLNALTETAWDPVDKETFATCWAQEIAAHPKTAVSNFHVVAGLLLPIWKRLPHGNPRVYRFTCNDGEPVIGLVVDPGVAASLENLAGVNIRTADAFAALDNGRTIVLAGGWRLRPARVMHVRRFELTGFAQGEIQDLKAKGLRAEIINWTLRLFVPVSDAADILSKLAQIRRIEAIV